MDKNIKLLPLIPLRGMNIFPYMVLHFDVGREKSILALEDAMLNNQEIFLVSQKQSKIEEPEEKDIYSIGTVCNIKQILKLPGDTIRVLVEGIKRGKISEYKDKEPFVRAEVEIIEDEDCADDKKCKALVRIIDKAFEEYINLSANNFPDALFSLEETEEPGRYCDMVSSYLILKPETKQELLETLEVIKRLEKLLFILKNEVEVLKIEKKIGTKVKSRIDKIQKEYYLREQIKAIQEELGEDDENKREIDEYESKITKAKLPKEAKEKAIYELNRLKGSGNYSAESGVIKAYLDWILALPWNKFTKDNIDINKAREVFDSRTLWA